MLKKTRKRQSPERDNRGGISVAFRGGLRLKIRLINFGTPGDRLPRRAHANDSGADVYANKTITLIPHETRKFPLGFGVEIPAGYSGYIYPRTSLTIKGVICHIPPIDTGYTGEVHAILTNVGNLSYSVHEGDRIGQLVISPVVIADFVTEFSEKRGAGAFGSTGV
jgi:dUTP pyrophosphatase